MTHPMCITLLKFLVLMSVTQLIETYAQKASLQHTLSGTSG
jgi:hypothetical protein